MMKKILLISLVVFVCLLGSISFADEMLCRNFTITETSGSSVLNKPFEYYFTNLTGNSIDAVFKADLSAYAQLNYSYYWNDTSNDFRIVNVPCGESGLEVRYQVIENTSVVESLYSVNDIITYRDSFEDADVNASYWSIYADSGTLTPSADYYRFGKQSLQIHTNEGGNAALQHQYCSPFTCLYGDLRAGATGTFEVYAREDGSVSEYYMSVDMGDWIKYMRASKDTSLSGTNYVWRMGGDTSCTGYEASPVAFVDNGSWWKSAIVVSSSGVTAYIENQSVKSCSEMTYVDSLAIAEGSNVEQTVYFDEFRFYQNVYDDPSQTYSVDIGEEQSVSVPADTYISLLFNFSYVDFGILSANTTDNPAANNYEIDVNTTGCNNAYIEFDAPYMPLISDRIGDLSFYIANSNFKFNYTKNTTPYPDLNVLDSNYNVSVIDGNIVYPFYYLSVPPKKEAGDYSTTHVIKGVCV